MSDSYKEQYPLLCEEASDEETLNSRRFRIPPVRGRARLHTKGATIIIAQWTDHWSTFAKYWWAAMGMLLITTFLVYNFAITLTMLPPTYIKPLKTMNKNTSPHLTSSNRTISRKDVFMHILVNNNEEEDLNKYLPFVDDLSNKYPDFMYHFITVFNDSHTDQKQLSAEEHNDIAFNALWSKEKIPEKPQFIKSNIDLHRITLTDYMDKSPLKKEWRHLPNNFIEFILRAVSIWDKGGIALNPTILTLQYPHNIYTKKVHNLFDKIIKCNENKSTELMKKKHPTKPKEKAKKKVNNIQDIIEILEHDDSSLNSPMSLSEVENKVSSTVVHSGRKLLSITGHGVENTLKLDPTNDSKVHMKRRSTIEHNKIDRNKVNAEIEEPTAVERYIPFYSFLENNKTSHLSILPLFFDLLFNDDKMNVHEVDEEVVSNPTVSRQRKSAMPIDSEKNNVSPLVIEAINNTNDKLKPVIISAKGLVLEDSGKNNAVSNISTACVMDELTIDLKGNIIATETPCHAFVGTVFSNVIHHADQNSVHDFIIQELSLFCNGLLSSCKGIDVI